MTLTTHGVIGSAAMVAAVEVLGPTPAGLACGCVLGFASHFAIDALPHWDEGPALLRSVRVDAADSLNKDMVLGKDFVHDLAILAGDALLGLGLSLALFSIWLFKLPPPIIFLGVVAGDLPDALQFVYWKTRLKIMRPLQKFHSGLDREFLDLRFLGIEVALVVVIVAALKIFL